MLAMTSLTFWIGSASFIVCLTLIVHALVPRPFADVKLLQPRKWSVLLQFPLECGAMFVWLATGLPLLGWMFWFGDNDHWFYHYAWIFAAVIALAASGVGAVRIFRAGATTRYWRVHFWAPIILLLSFASICGYESLRSIEGITLDSAVQKVFDRLAAHIDEPVRFVKHEGPLPYGRNDSTCEAYWILGAKEPRGRFSVCRHKWFGWQFSHSERFPPSADELKRAKQWITNPANRRGVVLILQSVIINYPNTPAETEAKELLESIGEPMPSQ